MALSGAVHGFVGYIGRAQSPCKRLWGWKFCLGEAILKPMTAPLDLNGARLWKEFLDRASQKALVDDLRELVRSAPFQRYETPGGRRMSVHMSGAGSVAWMSDRTGYRYSDIQPNGTRWPEIPERLNAVWAAVSGVGRPPDSCLFNYYGEGAKMGLHQDKDEADTQWPVVSISLGDEAQFRIGGLSRRDPTRSVWLQSGDVVVLTGASRLAYHGIDRIKFGSSGLLERGGRLNVTLRIAG